MELTEFLLARIAEDEEGAQALLPVYDGMIGRLKSPAVEQLALAPHFARHDPARLLAECEAKRRIVQVHQDGVRAVGEGLSAPTRKILRLLVLPYADHPDYKPDWKP